MLDHGDTQSTSMDPHRPRPVTRRAVLRGGLLAVVGLAAACAPTAPAAPPTSAPAAAAPTSAAAAAQPTPVPPVPPAAKPTAPPAAAAPAPTPVPPTLAPAAAGASELKLMSWVQFEPGRQDAWAALLDKFNTSQKSLHVSFVGWGAQDYQDRVLAQLQAGGIDADVITLIPNQAARLVQLDALSPIEDVIAKVGLHPSPSHNYITKDGHLYGISIVEVAFGLLYNQKLFDAAGISAPAADPVQWADQAEKLTRKPDQFGLWQPNLMSEQFSFWFFLQNFGLAYDGIWAQGQKPLLTSDPIIKALTLWQRLYGSAMAQGSNDAAAARLFSDGRIAQELVVSAGVNVIKSTGPAVYPDLRSAAAPWPSKKQISRLHPLSVVKTSKNQDAAKTFVEFMVQPENMAELMIKGLDVVPPYPEVTQVPAYQDFIKGLNWASGFLDIKPVSLLDVEGDFVFHDTEFGNVILTNFQKALLGQTSVEQAMADAQKEAEDLATRVFTD